MNIKAINPIFYAGFVVLFAQGCSTDTMALNTVPTSNGDTAAIEQPCKAQPISAELSLCDGSILNCSFETRTFPLKLAYGQQLDIPFESIDGIVLGISKDPSRVRFRNGDQLTGTLAVESLAVDSLLGSHKVQISNIKNIVIKNQTEKASGGLVYWCTFESAESIRKPAAGPEGEYHSGLFVNGKTGRALKTNGAKLAMAVNLPSGAFKNKGCVEFWARIEDPTRPFSGGGSPRIFTATTGNGGFWLEYNINNGHGMGGLCAVVAARPCGIPMSFSGTPQPYSTVLKDNPGGWHHYAVVWNDEGLKIIKAADGNPATFAVLLDGKLYSSRNFEGKLGSFARMIDAPVLFYVPHPNETDYRDVSFSIDELKIWNFDKMGFEVK